MKYRLRSKALLSLLTFILFAAFPSTIRADNLVLAGFDLFVTQPGTHVNLGPGVSQPFVGVPLGTFDFGSGLVATFNTDTIVQRLANATAASPTVPIELIAMQLMSVNQFDLGAGLGFHFVTLQSARSGPASLGELTINGLGTEPAPGEAHGTFDSFIDVFFDIRFGALDGPIVFSGSHRISSFENLWSHFPEPGTLEIVGVNAFLNGINRGNDFFPIGEVKESSEIGAHNVRPATIPEPTTMFLFGTGVAALAARLRMRSKARQKHESTR